MVSITFPGNLLRGPDLLVFLQHLLTMSKEVDNDPHSISQQLLKSDKHLYWSWARMSIMMFIAFLNH